MRRPFLDISVPHLVTIANLSVSPSWTAVSRQLVDVLEVTARRENAVFLVIGLWEGALPGIDRVIIRVKHAQTCWQDPIYKKAPASMKTAYVIQTTGRRIISSREELAS